MIPMSVVLLTELQAFKSNKWFFSRDAYNVTLVVKDGKWIVDTLTKLPKGTQPQISVEELAMAEDVVKKDARVIALFKEIG